jgi:hypothetical protein
LQFGFGLGRGGRAVMIVNKGGDASGQNHKAEEGDEAAF